MLSDPDSVENIIATTPGLDNDPAVLGLICLLILWTVLTILIIIGEYLLMFYDNVGHQKKFLKWGAHTVISRNLKSEVAQNFLD